MQGTCYVCGETPAKQCTGCHCIAYCSTKCQKVDWAFHKLSCKQKPRNVIDMIIRKCTLDHLVKKIFHFLSGRDLHVVRCVKRSWRDVIASMWNSKKDRKLFEYKLEHQWTTNRPRGRMVFEGHGMPADKIVHNNQELFLGCAKKDSILALDMDEMYKVTYISRWQTKVKYKIDKSSQVLHDNVWAVHKEFLIVSNTLAIKCWDRTSQKEMMINDRSALLQIGNGTVNRYNTETKDFPLKIEIFKNVLIILFQSGLVLKFYVSVSPPAPGQTQRIVTFNLLHSFELLLGISPIDPDDFRISHGVMSGYPNGLTRLYTKLWLGSGEDESDDDEEPDTAGIFLLEEDKEVHRLDDVDEIHDATRIGDDDYCLLARNHDSINGGSVSDYNIFLPTKYLELWKNKKCIRSLKLKGITNAKLNKYSVAVLTCPQLTSHVISVYKFMDFVDTSIRSFDLRPIKNTLRYPPRCILLTKNQLMWSLPVTCEEGCPACKEEGTGEEMFCVWSLNFWYAPHIRLPAQHEWHL